MHVVRFADAPEYEARGHPGVTARRVQGREAGGPESLYVSISDYPPGSGGSSTIGDNEVVYVVLAGEIRVLHSGTVSDLAAGDSVSFAAGEDRATFNATNADARLLVIHQSV